MESLSFAFSVVTVSHIGQDYNAMTVLIGYNFFKVYFSIDLNVAKTNRC